MGILTVKATTIFVHLRIILWSLKIITSFLVPLLGAVAILSSDQVCPHIYFILFSSTSKGEFCELPQSSKWISSARYELHPLFLAMVQEQSFVGRDNENPYHHLLEFDELCSCLMISGMTQETLTWKLVPYSLMETVKQWYTHVKSPNGDWNDLQDRFYLAFFLISCVIVLRVEVLSFHQD